MARLDFSGWLARQAERVETALDACLPVAEDTSSSLHEAMRYAVLGGGKRVRAALVYAAGEACVASGGGALSPAQRTALDRAAAALELIHAYSLIHDDLPCMDDDDLRRGRPTVHKQYDEAIAMLAGDALQPLAFELLAQMPIAPALVVQSVELLARAAGSAGMVGGQAIDCASVGQVLSRQQLQAMHAMKTGALLQAGILLGGVVAGASSQQRTCLEDYAEAVGVAFQVADDILDVVADTATLGKTAGKDAADNKPTYVSLLGLETAQALLGGLKKAAHDALRPLGGSGVRLGQLADFIADRSY